MSRYNVGAYIRLSRDERYSDSDSIDNQIKLADYYCGNKDKVFSNMVINCLPCIYDDYHSSPYKIGLFSK